MMETSPSLQKTPVASDVIELGTLALGAAALLDKTLGGKLGFRGLFPEPFDIGNHAMSMSVPVAWASFKTGRFEKHYMKPAITAAVKGELKEGHFEQTRKYAKRVALSAFLIGASYVVGGEVVSGLLHHAEKAMEKVESPTVRKSSEQNNRFAIGDFDWLDIIYGVGATGAFTATWHKKTAAAAKNNETVDTYFKSQSEIIAVSRKSKNSDKTKEKAKPAHNKRFTPKQPK